MEDSKILMAKVREKINKLGISYAEAASMIGVTKQSLDRHTDGSYVRSDSIAKYRRWILASDKDIAPSTNESKQEQVVPPTKKTAPTISPLCGPQLKPQHPHRVVDLFCGCGGLSLGFELADGGGLFRTTLAIDIETPMVRVFNDNHPCIESGATIGRQADLSEFINEAEILAFYLDHLTRVEADQNLANELGKIRPFGLGHFAQAIRALDQRFVEALTDIRSGTLFQSAYRDVSKDSLSQTSVIGFHTSLKLPQPGVGNPTFVPPLWGNGVRSKKASFTAGAQIPDSLKRKAKEQAEELWSEEINKLRDRAKGSGTGQLASAAKKIKESLGLLDGLAYTDIRNTWIEWRTERDSLRRYYFEDEAVLNQLRSTYQNGRQVQVLLGGPPCQGFSRIGRGKIRSLREQSVHVQTDDAAGDKRNELMLKYVLFVSALSPSVFLFENVRHFKAEVKTPNGTFNATQILAEAISNISCSDLEYDIHSKIIIATNHLVPQTRERFFMVGVRKDIMRTSDRESPAFWCLTLPERPPIPLKTALSGLPEPVYANMESNRPGKTSNVLSVEDIHIHGNGETGEYVEWIRQFPPNDRTKHDHCKIDGHCTRDSRADDRAFFEMLGPGKRWMDYRCDGNPIVEDLARLVKWAIKHNNGNVIDGLSPDRLRELLKTLDGSLSLRLLLDRIPLAPGEVQHHLCATNYLKKREGSHGDWLARLDAESPSKTMVSHMGKDTYAYIHPSSPRTISVREAARIQTFPDWYRFSSVGLVDGYRMIGNAVPPLLSSQLALRVAVALEEGGQLQSST